MDQRAWWAAVHGWFFFFFFFFGNTLRKQGRVVGRGVVMFSGSGSSREVELCLAPGLCRAGTSDEEVT